jgi:hypothetical protein
MLRGWDLPIQANISVSFNTKLILFNLVMPSAPPELLDLHLRHRPAHLLQPTCASSRPRSVARLPERRTARITDPTSKSKISFLLG